MHPTRVANRCTLHEPSQPTRNTLEVMDDARVCDLHVWSIGPGKRSCVATIISARPRAVQEYRERLAHFGLAHLTVEVERCHEGHDPWPP